MKRALIAVAIVLCALGGFLAWRASRRGPGPDFDVDWSPAHALSAGVSVREGKLASAPAWRIVDLSMDPSLATVRVQQTPGGARLADLIPPGAVAAVNGGYFDEHFRPTGWLVSENKEISGKQSRAQGGVLAMEKGRLFVGPMAALPFTPELAVQNSPRLIEPDGTVGIRSDDKKRAARTLACDAEGRLHLVVIAAPTGDGPTLLEAARWLAADPSLGGLGCSAALNLDGGPSTGVWLPASSGVADVHGAAPIAYALAVLPR
ncbi:MAG: phosphodiester glycosidase family protein [Deltaproteobacteria bacterium]|nr:phosphodiester glycosidase family protein [Deltaproteobacteria bacterium]